MLKKDESNDLDVQRLYRLYSDLSESNRALAKSMVQVEKAIAEQTIIIKAFDTKHTEHDRRLERHEERIRVVERKQDTCGAESQIRGIWHHIKRLNAFKDMITDRSADDSKVIDIHAIRMQEMAAKDVAALRSTAFRWIPWLLVAFAMGIALATMLIVQTVRGDALIQLPSPPKIQVKGE
ncbi:MAG: hypothetical protein PHI12_09125 [Dehalococcoidales bacterium]|nr:hypothetical protein [Dehalococcoidales bacterium]